MKTPRLLSELPTGARLAGLLLGVAAVAWVLASVQTDDASFGISAETEVLSVEPDCEQNLVWDLPAGRIGALREDGREPEGAAAIGVLLRGGARARVRVGQQGQWKMEFTHSDSFGCGGSAADVIVFTADDLSESAGGADVYYESEDEVAPGAGPVLMLRGRVVIGEEIPFGIGTADGAEVPLLVRARVEARTPDWHTRQRRLIHEETIDPGAMIDTHGCLDAPAGPQTLAAACVREARTASEGYLRAIRNDDRLAFAVQLAATGRFIGVRNQGGTQRRLLVTWWSRVVSSTFAQLFAAGLAVLAALAQIWSTIQRQEGTQREGRRAAVDDATREDRSSPLAPHAGADDGGAPAAGPAATPPRER